MNQEDWVSLPSTLKEKYQPISGFSSPEQYLIVLEKLKEYDTMPIELIESNTNAYKIFTEEYNSVLLTAHLFENLLILHLKIAIELSLYLLPNYYLALLIHLLSLVLLLSLLPS